MAAWMPYCGRVHDATDVATEVEVVAPDEVREFVAAHGGRLYVWVRVPPGLLMTPCMLEAALKPPRKKGVAFRRIGAPGFDLYLEASQRVWPRVLELALRRRRRVEAYWNGLAWIA